MTTDLRALCARMADELDYYRQLLMDDRREVHALAVEARTALAQQPALPAYGEVGELVRQLGSMAADAEAADFVSDAAVLDLAIKHLERLKPSQVVPPADGEVGELVEWLREQAGTERGCEFDSEEGVVFDAADKLDRTADLLERLAQDHLPDARKMVPTDGEAPTVMEIIELADEIEAAELGQVDLVRAALARWGNPAPRPEPPADEEVVTWLREAAAAAAANDWDHEAQQLTRAADLLERLSEGPAVQSREPASVTNVPSEQELKTFACEWWRTFGFVKDKATCAWVLDQVAPEHFADYARDVLAHWGNFPPYLIPVAERLPGPGDCLPWPQPSDTSAWCWMGRIVDGVTGRYVLWEQVPASPACREVFTHWLPAHTLPVPSADSTTGAT